MADDVNSLDDIDTLAHTPKLKPPRKLLKVPGRGVWGRHTSNTSYEIDASSPAVTRASILVHAFRKAVRDHYGCDGYVHEWSYENEEIVKHKLYDHLVKAASKLTEQHVAPYDWAHWYVGFYKKNREREQVEKKLKGVRKKGRPAKPPIKQVFSVGTFKKYRRIFKDETSAGVGYRIEFTREVEEKVLRVKEVHLRNRGFTIASAMDSMPGWYREMREKEVELGYDDPGDFFPE